MNTKLDPSSVLDNHANQLNPHHPAYYLARGLTQEEAEIAAAKARAQSQAPPRIKPPQKR